MSKNSPTDSIAQNLRSLCNGSQWSISQIAQYAGVSERTLRSHMQSSDSAKIATLTDYATVLDVTIDQLLRPNNQPARRQYLTGHSPLDQIIRAAIQSEYSEAARRLIEPHLHPHYICTSSTYDGEAPHHRLYQDAPTDVGRIFGIAWGDECERNRKQGRDSHELTIDRAIVVGLHQVIVVQDSVDTWTAYQSRTVVETTRRTSKTLVQFYFSTKISSSTSNSETHPWFVTRKHWEIIEQTEIRELQTISPA